MDAELNTRMMTLETSVARLAAVVDGLAGTVKDLKQPWTAVMSAAAAVVVIIGGMFSFWNNVLVERLERTSARIAKIEEIVHDHVVLEGHPGKVLEQVTGNEHDLRRVAELIRTHQQDSEARYARQEEQIFALRERVDHEIKRRQDTEKYLLNEIKDRTADRFTSTEATVLFQQLLEASRRP